MRAWCSDTAERAATTAPFASLGKWSFDIMREHSLAAGKASI